MTLPHRLLPLLLATLFVVAALPAAATATKAGVTEGNPRGTGRAAAAAKNRIVIQVNEGDSKQWNSILANIRNIQAELGLKNVAITVVAIGPGLGLLDALSVVASPVQDALGTGSVEFVACGNSMTAQHVAKSDLIEGTRVAAAGYVEIMRLQQQGWIYLRP